MNNNAVPVLVEDEEATTPVPRLTMAELVWGDEAPENEAALYDEGPLSYAEDR